MKRGKLTYRDLLRLLMVVLALILLAACGPAAPPAAETTEQEAAAQPAAEEEAAEEPAAEEPAAEEEAAEEPAEEEAVAEEEPAEEPAAAEASMADLPEVPRNRTLIIMNGGPNQYALFDNQNPYIPGSDQGFHMGTLPATFEPLIMFNVLTGEYENWLAESWEYNDDFTEITMKLREGVTWNDGMPFTANDVAFTFNMLKEHADQMVHLADLPAYLEEAQAVDELTVQFILNKPNPAFWATTLTTNHGIHVLPEHIWKDQDPLEFTNYDLEKGWPVGTGPYRMVFGSPQQKVFDLRDDWWAAQTGFKPTPKVERIIYLPSQDESQAAQLLITNQIDMGPIMQVSTLKSVFAQNPKVITFTGQEPPYGYLDWCPIDLNLNASVEPYNDPDIRWALTYAVDREKLVALAESGAGVPALHPFTPYAWFEPLDKALQETFAEHNYGIQPQPDKVTEIMESKGYTKDSEGLWAKEGEHFTMNIYVPEWLKAYGPPLTQQLRDAGFDAAFDTSPGLNTPSQTGEQKEFLGCKGPSGVLGMDPYFMLSIYTAQYFRDTGEPAPIWWATSRWQNAEYDQLVEQIAPLKVDDPKTEELFLQAMDIWVEEMPDVYLAQLIIRYPMSTEYWSGWPSAENSYGFPHSWQWELLKTFINLEPTQ
jgi:peptide/nickel transport system substrate-binding protein